MTSDTFNTLLAISISALEKNLFSPFVHFLIFLLFSSMNSLIALCQIYDLQEIFFSFHFVDCFGVQKHFGFKPT